MITTLQCCRNSANPLHGFRVDVRQLPLGERYVGQTLERLMKIALNLSERAGHMDFTQNAVPPNDAANRERIEEFIGEDTACHMSRQILDPFHGTAPQALPLNFPHRGAALENLIGERIVLENFSNQQTPARAKLNDRELVRGNSNGLCHLSELAGEQLPKYRIEIRRRVEIALPADRVP